MMNCRKAEPLIPLFVEADLDAVEMQQMTTHLETCAACRETVAEFQASQSWLHATAPPTFDELLLKQMRSTVMQSVAPPAMQPSFSVWWQPFRTWKFAFTAAVVLLFVGGMIVSRRGTETSTVRVASGAQESTVAARAMILTDKDSEKNARPTTQGFQPRTGRKQKDQRSVNVSDRNSGSETAKQPNPAKTTDVANQIAAAVIAPSEAENDAANFPRVDTLSATLPPAPQSENATGNLEKSLPEPEMLRMEIQTADPNIRIIWLTPKEPVRTSPVTDTNTK